MGIDIYMNWGNGPSFDGNYEEAFCGANGYLRESYHGGPYANGPSSSQRRSAIRFVPPRPLVCLPSRASRSAPT